MAAQKGAELLLKIDISGTKTTIGGLRSTSLTLNDESVDITNKDSAGKRTLLAAAGITSMSVSGSGVFTDDAAIEELRGAYGNSAFDSYEIIIPDFGKYTGSFQVTSLEYAGEYNGEVTYSVTLESAGAITWATV